MLYFEEATSQLICIAPKTSTALVAALFDEFDWEEVSIAIEARLVSFECESGTRIQGASEAELKIAAGKSWQTLERLAMTTKSGQRDVAVHRVGRKTKKEEQADESMPSWKQTLGAEESGAILELEPVLGRDMQTIDFNFCFRRRFRVKTGMDQLEVLSSFQLGDGATVAGYVWPRKVGTVAAPGNGRLSVYALLFHAELLNAKGRPFTAAEFEETARRYRERRANYHKTHDKAEERLEK